MLGRQIDQEAEELNSFFRTSVLEAGSLHPLVSYRLMGLDLETVWENVIGQTLDLSLAEALAFTFPPPSCGATANGICDLFTSEATASRLMQTSLTGCPYGPNFRSELTKSAAQGPALIRMSLYQEMEGKSGKKYTTTCHDYIILVTGLTTRGPVGYIYQSNIAEGMEDNGFSLFAWFKDEEKSGRQDLLDYLITLDKFLTTKDNQERAFLYQKIYMSQPIVKVETPANIEKLTHNQVFGCTYQMVSFNPKKALKKIKGVIADASLNEQELRALLGVSDNVDLAVAYMNHYLTKTQECYTKMRHRAETYKEAMQNCVDKYADPAQFLELCKAIKEGDFTSREWSPLDAKILRLYECSLKEAKKILNASPDVKAAFYFEDVILHAVKSVLSAKKKEFKKIIIPTMVNG